MIRILSLMVVALSICGCAETRIYDPLKAAQTQTYILNETALKNVRTGMTLDEVHAFMGQSMIIGYSYQNNSQAKPLTINNPYKSANVKTAKGECLAEYYVTAVHQPDGIVSDDELMPLIFCSGILTYKGRDAIL